MKRTGSRKNDESDRGESWDDAMPTHTDPDGDPRMAMSAKAKAAHDRGTMQARLAIVAIVVFMSLLAATRPLYGPYIDRFGVNNDQTMMERIGSHLQERARRHNLETNPRPWGSKKLDDEEKEKEAEHRGNRGT